MSVVDDVLLSIFENTGASAVTFADPESAREVTFRVSELPKRAAAVEAVNAYLRSLPGVSLWETIPRVGMPDAMGTDNGRYFAVVVKPVRAPERPELDADATDLALSGARYWLAYRGAAGGVRLDAAAVWRDSGHYGVNYVQGMA
jgi:hypothetical protein